MMQQLCETIMRREINPCKLSVIHNVLKLLITGYKEGKLKCHCLLNLRLMFSCQPLSVYDAVIIGLF